FLNLFDVFGRDRRGCKPFLRLAHERRIGVAIQRNVFVAGEHPFLADCVLKLLFCWGEIARTHARREFHFPLLIAISCATPIGPAIARFTRSARRNATAWYFLSNTPQSRQARRR